MADSNVKRVVIEFDPAADAPRGAVSAPGGAATSFDGWLQLLAALEQLVGELAATDRGSGAVAGHELPAQDL